jgi:hypothetical protein
MKDSVVQRMRAELEQEREALSARLESIDLVLDNLSRVYAGMAPVTPRAKKIPRATPSPRLVKDDDTDAVQRRVDLLRVIGKSEVGLTLGELRKQTPKMDGKDRSNALRP